MPKPYFYAYSLCLLSALSGCGPTDNSTEKPELHYAVSMPQEWRVHCVGGEGIHGEPIRWIFESWQPEGGRVRGKVIDADGYVNTFAEYRTQINIRTVYFDEIAINGRRAPLTNDFKRFSLNVGELCPGGWVGDRLL